MSNIFIFPGDMNGEPIVFADLVNDASKTKLLVLYNDATSLNAQEFITKMTDAHPDDYKSVIFLSVSEPSLILTDLQTLPVNIGDAEHSLDWNMYSSYRIISISPSGILSDVVTADQLDEAYGSIKDAIFYALGNG